MVLRFVFWIFVSLNPIVESSALCNEPCRIVGGDPANITELPYQLALLDTNGAFSCGASIIHHYWAIIAAHCVKGIPARALVLRSGSSYKLTGGALHHAEMIIMHPDYYKCAHLDYDVAVIKVITPFVYSDVTQNILMATRSPGAEIPAVVSGWGRLKYHGELPDQLHKTTVYIQDYNKCKQRYTNRLTPRMLCAAVPDGTKDSCNGDSGGPLVAKNKLVGIVSWGDRCADKDSPGVYTDVAKVRKWVISTIRNNSRYCGLPSRNKTKYV